MTAEQPLHPIQDESVSPGLDGICKLLQDGSSSGCNKGSQFVCLLPDQGCKVTASQR